MNVIFCCEKIKSFVLAQHCWKEINPQLIENYHLGCRCDDCKDCRCSICSYHKVPAKDYDQPERSKIEWANAEKKT